MTGGALVYGTILIFTGVFVSIRSTPSTLHAPAPLIWIATPSVESALGRLLMIPVDAQESQRQVPFS